MQPEADPYGLDPEFRAACTPLARFFFERYWRVDVAGLANVPTDGPAILVGNHSGALPFDAVMLSYAISELDGGPRRIPRPLYAPFLTAHRSLDEALRKVGGVPASFRTAEELLAAGELVMIFPEGVDGVAKPFSDRYTLGRFATSAARLSCRYRIPIVPFSVVGAEEIYPMVARSRRLGELVGVPHMPITPLFPLLGPAGALPLPTKWSVRFGSRIHLYRENRFRGDGRTDFDRMTDRLRRTVEVGLRRQLSGRESVFFG